MFIKAQASLIVLAAALVSAPAGHAQTGDLDQSHALSVARQPLDEALADLGQQLGMQIIVFSDDASDFESVSLDGEYTGADALAALLEGTGLVFKEVDATTIAVGAPERLNPKTAAAANQERAAELPSPEQSIPQTEDRAEEEVLQPISAPARQQDSERQLVADRVIVTGTRIRGAQPAGSPLLTLNSDEIVRAGYGTAADILNDLPQNFGGDASEEILTTDAGGTNFTGSKGVNLRGLGASATLTLVNGRRLAQNGGSNGSFADVSSIPVSAIERVEILTDGASAIYGSDAISGVVNFILKEDYEGAETSLRYSDTSQGGANDIRFSQSYGSKWNSGNLFANYEYYSRNNLRNEDRPYTSSVDLSPFGGTDFRLQNGANPGTIVVPVVAAIPTGQDGTSLTPGDLLVGQENLFDTAKNRDLLKEQERQSLYLSLTQELGPQSEAFAELRASKREFSGMLGGDTLAFQIVPASHPYYVSPAPDLGLIYINYDLTDDLGPTTGSGETTNITGALGVDYEFGNDWRLEAYGSYTVDDAETRQSIADRARVNEAVGLVDADPDFDPMVDGYFNPFGDGSNSPQNVLDYIGAGYSGIDTKAEGWSFNMMADGEIFRLPGGGAKLAIGGELRGETFEKTAFGSNLGQYTETTTFSIDRDIAAAFAELYLPFVGEGNARPGIQRLEASAAIRYEEYSDFGNTTNPKLGLAWQPVDDLTVRGTWGTSFKAPRLNDLVPDANLQSGTFPAPDPSSPTGTSILLLIQGANPDLQPETSTAWTAGFDYEPSALPDAALKFTYYDISFEDRIGVIPGAFANLLIDPAFLPILDRSPDPAEIAPYFDSPFPDFSNGAGVSGPGDIEVVADVRPQNLASTEVRGLDAEASYTTGFAGGDISYNLNLSYIFEFVQMTAPNFPGEDLAGSPGRPANLRGRFNTSWTRDSWQLGGAVNYVQGYDDTNQTPARSVDDYITTDLVAAWTPQHEAGWQSGLRLALNVSNVFDEAPPFLNQPLGYDAANADPYGRVIALSLSKAW
jgi:iron complex outermembrane recepter protein